MDNITIEDLNKYLGYLKFIQEKLDSFFEDQKPFIFCKKGCGDCCKKQRFPYSQMEFQYLLLGASRLDLDIQDKIRAKINKLLEQKKQFSERVANGSKSGKKDAIKEKKFLYDCPFLVDDVCTVYEYRGLICRSFGLITRSEDGGMWVPFCWEKGLNYSNVICKRTKRVSEWKCKHLHTDTLPNVYNVKYNDLADEELAKTLGFSFGEKMFLVDWFELLEHKGD